MWFARDVEGGGGDWGTWRVEPPAAYGFAAVWIGDASCRGCRAWRLGYRFILRAGIVFECRCWQAFKNVVERSERVVVGECEVLGGGVVEVHAGCVLVYHDRHDRAVILSF